MPIPPSLWPLSGLQVRTERLELRLPTETDLVALAALAAEGLLEREFKPFGFPWTEGPREEVAERVLRWHWGRWSTWKPSDWSLEFAVVTDGLVVGTQGIAARDFAVLREVRSGSWLGRPYQGRGLGTEMRAAALHLAFDGLGALAALSDAFEDNPASLRVSEKLGYLPDGTDRLSRRGIPAVSRRLRLERERWQELARRPEVEVTGLDPCLPWFGLVLEEAGSSSDA
jgi:RimJ/RimL family protein N-acetyltransferase